MANLLDSIQTATDRCQICTTAAALQSDPVYLAQVEAENQASLQRHYLNLIVNWCNETNTQLPGSAVGQLSLPINQLIASNILDAWEASLIAKEYIVSRNGSEFKITVE